MMEAVQGAGLIKDILPVNELFNQQNEEFDLTKLKMSAY